VTVQTTPSASTTPATRYPTERSRIVGLLLAVVLLVLTCVASLAVGTQNVSLATVWHAVTDYHDIGDQWIVHELRVPRTVLALVVGLALGLAGTHAVSRPAASRTAAAATLRHVLERRFTRNPFSQAPARLARLSMLDCPASST
jgi:hypothetical protein